MEQTALQVQMVQMVQVEVMVPQVQMVQVELQIHIKQHFLETLL
jgi:hypothetical protein